MKEQETAGCNGQIRGGVRSDRVGWLSVVFVICLFGFSNTHAQDDNQVYVLDIPAQDAAAALDLLAEQTGSITLFPYNLASSRQANKVVGRYTLQDALDILLKDTGLSGDISEKRVLSITQQPDAERTNEEEPMEHKKTGLAVILAAVFAGPTASAQGNAEDVVLDEIIVLGATQSAKQSVERKRVATQFVDTISALDIGKLPDENIAEALQRVPGVQISRDADNVFQLAVRGLPQNNVLINGRPLIGSSSNGQGVERSVGFVDFPSELLYGIDVIKSPSADMLEGSLGGTINLRTARPFNFDGFQASLTLRGIYNDEREDWGNRYSGLISNTWDLNNGRFGALLNISISDQRLREYRAGTEGFQTDRNLVDVNGNGILGEAADEVVRPNFYINESVRQDRTRDSLSASIQWENDTSEFYTDVLWTDFEQSDFRNGYLVFPDSSTGATVQNAVVSSSGTLLAGDISGARYAANGVQLPRNRETFSVAVGGGFDIGDRAHISGEVSVVDSDGGEMFYIPQEINTAVPENYFVDLRRSEVPVIRFGFDPTDENNFILGGLFQNRWSQDSDETSTRVDFDYDLGDGGFESIEVGLRFSSLEGNQSRRFFGGGLFNGQPLSAYPGNFVNPAPVGDFFGDTDFVSTYLTSQGEVPSNEEIQQLTGFPSQLTDSPADAFTVEEDNTAGYVKLNFGSQWGNVPVTGNFGVRVVNTDQTSQGFLIGENSSATPLTVSRSYTDVLPSLNAKFDLNDTLVFRFGAAKVIARSSLENLAPNTSLNFFSFIGTRGNPNLDPFEILQFDAALEWYFGDGDLLAATVFYKDIESFVVSRVTTEQFPDDQGVPTNFDITSPENGEGGDVTGLELVYQQTFEGALEGFGVQANFTYADSSTPNRDANGAAIPVEGLSETSYNLVGFYENYGFYGRLAYNWRDEFVFATFSNAGLPAFIEDRGQLDLSLSYDVHENVTLTLDATNLTNEGTRRFAGVEERLSQYYENGTTYLVGARVSF